MLLLVSIASFIFFDRASFEKFGYSLVTTSLFASNIWFWTETGYFAPSALEKPLLHTWSLCVEEQFYLFFPLLLLLCRRFLFQSPLLIISYLFILSFSLYLYGFYFHPNATFFLLPTRIWQLLAGSIIALLYLNRSLKFENLGIHTFGVSLVLISLFPQFNSALRIPPAISCTVGTALILLPIQNSWIVKVLSFKPLIWLGLLSYSLYLWHWPIYVFYKYLSFENIDTTKKLLLVLLSLFFAWCSWRYIESPFRKIPILLQNKKYFFIPAGLFLSVCILFGTVIIHKKGMAFRHPQWDKIDAQSFGTGILMVNQPDFII
jgi:peptidoglycan/LPS O-acetylase OafA/YrhL